jgi:hypothetical protein
MAILDTLLGGALAAGAGLIVTEYESWKVEKRKMEHWEQRFKHLLSRFETDINPDNNPGTGERLAYVKSSSELVDLLEDHMATREQPLLDETLEKFSNLRADVARLEAVADRSINDDKVLDNIQRISTTASELEASYSSTIDDSRWRLLIRDLNPFSAER